MSENQSFLPDDYLSKRIARRTNIICGVLFAIVMLGIVAAYFVTNRQRGEIRKQQAQVNARFEDAARRLDQLQQLQSQKAQMIRKAKVTSVLVERIPRSTILAELINHMPATLSLMEMDLDTKQVKQARRVSTAIQRRKLEDQKKQDDDIEVLPTKILVGLTGIAPTDVEVSTFMSRLNAHPMFSEVTLQYSEQVVIDKQTMRKFRLSMEVPPSVELDDFTPTRVARGKLRQNPMSTKIQIDGSGQLVSPTAEVPVPNE